jgi:hypothetical protein
MPQEKLKFPTIDFLNKPRFFFLGLIFTVLFILNQFKFPMITYLPFDLPGNLKASTIPPFGIFIERQYMGEPQNSKWCTVLQHELEHWEQYKRMGLFSFYYNYLQVYVKSGRIDHWMERESDKNCKQKLKRG